MKKPAKTPVLQTAIASLCLCLAACGGSDDPQTSASTGTSPGSGTSSVPSYAIGGTVAGLGSQLSLKLLDNSMDPLALNANGSFSFATPIPFNRTYAVTIGTQPLGFQWCSVANGSGTATANVTNVAVTCTPAKVSIAAFVGSGASALVNGQGATAAFNTPLGMVVDATGNLYVADSNNNVIRKVDALGNVTTLAGSAARAYADGQGTAASFATPTGVAIDANGNVYVSDSGNNMIRKIDPSGNVTTVAGSTTSGYADGQGAAASFSGPMGVAVDASGNLYVSDNGNGRIRKVDPSGNVTTIAGSATRGHVDGQGAAASFGAPFGIAVDASGNLYVADFGNNEIRKIDPSANVTTLAGSTTSGHADGQGVAASFNNPFGITIDKSGYLYVADGSNNAIRMVSPSGNVTTLAGPAANSQGTAVSFNNPYGVAVAPNGNLYMADSGRGKISVAIPVAP